MGRGLSPGGGALTPPRVSILLLTRNGAATLPDVFAALARQRSVADIEIVAVDSDSTDGTRALLERSAHRVIDIAPTSFNHGLTRNVGVAACRGELVVLLVQDAVPASDTWLARLIAPLAADESLAGTFARQVPRVDASAVTRRALARYLAGGDTPRVAAVEPEAFARMTPLERLGLCTFDNVCACLRRAVWTKHPFAETPIAEDLEWARDVLLAGHRLAFVPEAAVVHSHERSARYELARTYLVHRRLWALFRLALVPTAPALARAIVATLREHARIAPPTERPRARALAVAWPLGQYLGARAERRGWRWRPGGV